MVETQYLGRKNPTNVLAFPMDGLSARDTKAGVSASEIESAMLGDVVISVDTALRESKEFGESVENTIDRLLIHGILHILGYDHEKSAEKARMMEKEERRLMTLIKEG